MNTKKVVLFFVAFFCTVTFVFSEIESERLLFKDAKLTIELVGLGNYYGRKYYRANILRFENKTNYEMKVTCSYKISMQYDESVTSKRNTEEKFTGKVITIKPNSIERVIADNIYGNGYIEFIELIHYQVMEKNYEIR